MKNILNRSAIFIIVIGLFAPLLINVSAQTFEPVLPGSQMLVFSDSGSLQTNAPLATYTFDLVAGQSIAARVRSPQSRQLILSIKDPQNNQLASVTNIPPNQVVGLESISDIAEGVWTVEVATDEALSTSYTLDVVLNAAMEHESTHQSTNDSISTAEDLNPIFKAIDNSTGRIASIAGHLQNISPPFDVDTYQFTASAGQTVSLAAQFSTPQHMGSLSLWTGDGQAQVTSALTEHSAIKRIKLYYAPSNTFFEAEVFHASQSPSNDLISTFSVSNLNLISTIPEQLDSAAHGITAMASTRDTLIIYITTNMQEVAKSDGTLIRTFPTPSQLLRTGIRSGCSASNSSKKTPHERL